jgi:putative inorganic carbon (hco3(-)) transporter
MSSLLDVPDMAERMRRMVSAPDPRAQAGDPRGLRDRLAGLLLPVAAVLAAAVAAVTAVGIVSAGSPLPVLLGLAAAVGIALVVVAVVSIEAFVLVVLVARASLDALKVPGGSPAGVDPAAVLAVLFAVAVSLWLLAQRRAHERHTEISVLDRALLLFIGAAFLGILVSPLPAVSAVEWARIASTAPMLLLVERIALRRRTTEKLLVAVYASSAVPLCLAAYQALTGNGVFVAGGFDRVRGTFTHSNPFSVFLVLLVVMAVSLLPHLRGRARAGLVVFLAAAVPALLATYTRGAWIAAFLGLVVVGALQSRRLLIGLLAAATFVVIAVPSVGARFADLSETTQASGTPGNSLSWRLDYWSSALELSEQSPISGVGLKMVAAQAEEGKQPHNDFIRSFVELGVAGIAAYVWLLVAFARTAAAGVRATARSRGPDLDRGIAIGFAGAVTAFVVLSAVANVISQVVLLWYFLAFAGLSIAVARRAGQGDGGTEPRPAEERRTGADPARQ